MRLGRVANLDTIIPAQYSEAFDLIVRYAEREGWIPIGRRTWTVGPWQIIVNGTRETHEGIPPFHAFVEHAEIISMMLLHPVGGIVGGWRKSEADFVAAMRIELGLQ